MNKETEDRIKADAAKYTNKIDESLRGKSSDYGRRISKLDGLEAGYIAGATAEHAQNESVRLQLEAQDSNVEILLSQKKELIDKAQVLVDGLELICKKLAGINDTITNDIVNIAEKHLQQWKGKEVEP